MTEGESATLGHFTTYRLTEAFWALEPAERRQRAGRWLDSLEAAAEVTQLYLVSGVESGGDLLVWNTQRVPDTSAPGRFFLELAGAQGPHRALIEPVDILWGLTRPSEYSRSAKSAQEIDPFAAERAPYLIAYPFTKTADWYLLGSDARQGLMNEHIRIGKQYREITQLLLYSFGLQDQEFVVVYETEDLTLFSRLVHQLRATEARRFTQSDSPLHTGIHVDRDTWLDTLG